MGETTKSNIQEKAYGELTLYSEHTHQICRWVLKINIILFFVIPVFLIVLCVLSDGDKVITLIVWIVLMFVMAAVIILVGYFDHRLNLLLASVHGEDHKSLELIPEIKSRPTREELVATIKARPTFSKIEAYPDFTDLIEDPETNEIILNTDKEIIDKELAEMLEEIISNKKEQKESEKQDPLGNTPELDIDDILNETKAYEEKFSAESAATSDVIMSDLDAFIATDLDEVEL